MIIMKKLLSISIIVLMNCAISLGQETSDIIGNAIKVGNYKELSKFFDTKVDLTIGSKEASYSKAQAELIVKDFFAKDKISNYQVIHRGKSPDGAQYAIGTLTTAKTTYRTYVLTKDMNGGLKIQQLRFEATE